jgi:ATP-dependent Clp protease ATP-binding subunit ClpA
MTTNAGSDRSGAAAGFAISEQTAAESKTQKALEGFLRPEFINRVDEIITFRQLDESDFVRIARIMLEELKTSLAEKSIALAYTDDALELIARESFSRKFGARNMRRYIQKEVEDRLAEEIISDYTHQRSVAKISVENGKINVICM